MDKPFKFKEFIISHEKCAMKIGTDGVLLGAWTSLDSNPETILDIGTGTGVIALQLAQRSNAEIIDALEIDAPAYEQAVENFENSPWADRLFCYHGSIQEFSIELDEKYELIVSNPPFYNDDYKTDNLARNQARFTNSLPFKNLLDAVNKCLSDQGIFSTIIPFKEEDNFIDLAQEFNLFPKRICRVKGTEKAAVKRSLLSFSRNENEVKTTALTIEIERHQYTQAYRNLVKDFYIKM